jgi:putative ABC transport system permease protein
MSNLLKIALRNLFRYRRRTLVTMALIVSGMVFVLVFVAVTGSFKDMMVGQITDSFLGQIQIHRRGYLASIDNLPLQLNLRPKQVERVEKLLQEMDDVVAFSERLKFGAAFSNFEQTTNIRMNGVDPSREFATCPLLLSRMVQGAPDPAALERGRILVPLLLARGMKVEVGDTVVVIATNRDGSVNGATFVIGGILESATGPGGRDGYVHIEDARELLRLGENEVSEVAVRVRDFDRLGQVHSGLASRLRERVNEEGRPVFEVHTWEKLSPFSDIADMIDIMAVFVKLMLVSVVLISIMNVMLMAVYERIREIGTMAAIGTLPRRILSLHVAEGFLLGVMGAAGGTVFGTAIVWALGVWKMRFAFGRQEGLLLEPTLAVGELGAVSGLVILVSVLASLQPAWRASRMAPIDALRHV